MASMQYVVFRLSDELYGAEIYALREIILPQTAVKVPNNPDFIEGVIDYRGEMVPVLDLKKRFHLGNSDYNRESRYIVTDAGEHMTAFVVDEVTEILRVEDEDVEEAPEITRIRKDYITGMARMQDRLIVLLNLTKILTVEEQEILGEMIQE